MTMILSLVAIGVLLIPAYATYSIETQLETKVFEVEGLYTNGTALDFYEPVNKTLAELSYGHDIDVVYGADANNDTIFYGYNSTGVDRHRGYYGDYAVYTGNSTYTITPDWSDVPDAWFSGGRVFIFELDITGETVSNFDWLKFSTCCNATMNLLVFRTSSVQVFPMTETSDGEFIVPVGLALESQLNERPTQRVFIQLGVEGIEQFADEPVSFTVMAEGYNFTPADAPTFDDESLYIMALLISNAIFIVAIAFTSNPIDLKIDKRKR